MSLCPSTRYQNRRVQKCLLIILAVICSPVGSSSATTEVSTEHPVAAVDLDMLFLDMFSLLGRDMLYSAPYDLTLLQLAKRCLQTHYRLTNDWELRRWHEVDCLDTGADPRTDEERSLAHQWCIAWDSSPEAWLAEVELRLKILRAQDANEKEQLALQAKAVGTGVEGHGRLIFGGGWRRDTTRAQPPREIPPELLDRFTMNNSAKIYPKYRDDSHAGVYLSFGSRDIVAMERLVRLRLSSVSYPDIDVLLYRLLDAPLIDTQRDRYVWVRDKFKNAVVGVLGSTQPWYEAMAIAAGAASVCTIEYNQVSFQHPRMRSVTPAQYWAQGETRETFEIILSLSSFEHDGLGRYGDPIDPDGDLRAMRECAQMLQPEGLLLLAVPIAADAIAWNQHRIYGRRRLRLLLQGWKVLHTMGLIPEHFARDTPDAQQPVLLLTPRQFGDDDYSDLDFLL